MYLHLMTSFELKGETETRSNSIDHEIGMCEKLNLCLGKTGLGIFFTTTIGY